MEIMMAIIIGICLSATSGFRVFTPLLVTSVFHHLDWITLTGGFEWIGSMPAIITFSVATLLEVLSNYIPFISSILKAIAVPAAIIAGSLLMAAYIGDMNDFLRWSIAIIAGGGSAGAISTSLVPIKASSELIPVVGPMGVSFVEDFIAIITPILVFVLPILAFIIISIIFVGLFMITRAILSRRRKVKSGLVS